MDHILATPKGNIVFTQLPVEATHPSLNILGSSTLFVSSSSNIAIKAQKFQLEDFIIYHYTAKTSETVEITINGQADKLRCIIAENESLEFFSDNFRQEQLFKLPPHKFIIHYGVQTILKLTLRGGLSYSWYKLHFPEDMIQRTLKKLHLNQPDIIDNSNYLEGPLGFTPATLRYLKSITNPNLFSLHAISKLGKVDLLEIIVQQAYGKRTALNNAVMQKMTIADKYIRSNFKENLTISTIAKHVQMSESSFSSYFRTFYGVSSNFYINELKMHHAAALLRERNLTIQQISAHLGYKSEKGFRKSFVKYFGKLPKAFN